MTDGLQVLMLEDDANDAALLSARLESAGVPMVLTRVHSEATYLAALEAHRWDVILSDYNVPGYDGARALLAARDRVPSVPFLFVTGALGEERAVELLKLGATDYILKDRPERLAASIARAVAEAREKAERKRAAEFEQQLVAIVSHDLRNPLNVILLASSVAKTIAVETPELKRLLDRIHKSSELAARMICDILDFSQSRRGGIQIVRSPGDLYDLVVRTIEDLDPAVRGQRIALTRDGDTSGEWDSDRIAQVITNLVTNGVRYSAEGSDVTVAVGGAGDRVVLTVHNRGAPIPRELQARLFRPMQRGDDAVNRAVRSVGLGLYIAEHIVHAHGGTIGVSSDPDTGTTFRVELPRTGRTA